MCRGEFFLKINKRADQNKAVQGEFFLKIDKRAGMSIWHTRVVSTNKRRSHYIVTDPHLVQFNQVTKSL